MPPPAVIPAGMPAGAIGIKDLPGGVVVVRGGSLVLFGDSPAEKFCMFGLVAFNRASSSAFSFESSRKGSRDDFLMGAIPSGVLLFWGGRVRRLPEGLEGDVEDDVEDGVEFKSSCPATCFLTFSLAQEGSGTP
mmetsp:Transcript_34743/g.48169  ORF Transcript_34743/g.48169 Transcript_34743/m.48169 type:complete len:134 (-) Transcript_34743:355-756(-)